MGIFVHPKVLFSYDRGDGEVVATSLPHRYGKLSSIDEGLDSEYQSHSPDGRYGNSSKTYV